MEAIVCPTCGQVIDHAEDIWTVQGRYYCSELCGKRAKIRLYEELIKDHEV